jgi:flagellar hook protein FlgE
MSLYGALFSGVSGLSAESSAMGAISDNISNVNTIGYKQTDVNFQTLVTAQASTTEYSPGGVQSKPRMGVDMQGLLQASTSSTDLAISGGGFFVVNSDNQPLSSGKGEFAYTRAGSFKVDKDGYLQNVGGWYVQGWPLANWDGTPTASHQMIGGTQYMAAYKATNGQYTYINTGVVDPTNMQSLNLNKIAGTAAATTSISMGANLPSGDAVGTTHQTNLLEYDSLGNSHNVLMTWTKQGQNAWSVAALPPEGTKVVELKDGSAAGNIYAASGRLDMTSVPDSGAFTMTINGATFTFNAAAGTDGTPANNLYADPTGVTSTGTYAATMANEINKAFLTEYSGSTTTAAAATAAAAGNINITVNGTTTAVAITAGQSLSSVITAINAKTSTTNVAAWDNNGQIAYYSTNASGVNPTIADTTGSGYAPTPATIASTGLTYAQQVAGTGSIVFNQYDTNAAHTITVAGLTSLKKSGTMVLEQAYAPTSPDTFNVDPLAATVYSGTNGTANSATAAAITFNGDGTPSAINIASMSIQWANGSQDQTTAGTTGVSPPITLSLGDLNVSDGMTQLAGNYQLSYMSQNGAKFGNFSGVSIGTDGIVTAQFDNGVTRPIFQIPVATFVNPNGMQSLTGNTFLGTDFSGSPTVRVAGTAGAGQVDQSSLEASTVDIGTQFTDMIVTQRAYSAAAKVITTANQMLDDLISIIR